MRLRSQASVLALGVSAATLTIVPSASAGVLDQSQPTIDNSAIGFVSHVIDDAQTYTNGINGRLDQVDLAITRSSQLAVPLQVEIRTVSGGIPSSVVLARATVQAANVPGGFIPVGFVSVPLAPAAQVTAGARYAIELSSSNCGFQNCYHWGLGPLNDPYPPGVALVNTLGGPGWRPPFPPQSSDFAFKTYVVPGSATPTSKGQCKKGGWKRFTNPSFKNQGQCVKFVNHHSGKGKGDEQARGKENQGKKNRGKKNRGKKGRGKKP